MAPRRGMLLRAPLPPPEASSTSSHQPETQQVGIESDARLSDSYLDPIKVQLLSPRVAEPDKPKERPPFDWDKRLDDKLQYERHRYLKHHYPHHRLSHDIFDTLMLDTAHDASLGHRSVPMELAPGQEANNINGEGMVSSDIHIAIVTQQPTLAEQKTEADGDTEIETQTFLHSSSSSSLTHKSPSTNKHDNPPQRPITSCTLNSTCSSKSTKTPTQIHPVPNQIIFHHPHKHSTSTHNTHAINNASANTSPPDNTHLASLAIFICIVCFFICGWQACTSWHELHRRRRCRRRQRSGRAHGGRGRQRKIGHYTPALLPRSSGRFTDDPETALTAVEMADLAPFADLVATVGEEGMVKEMLGDGYRDFPLESPVERGIGVEDEVVVRRERENV